VIHVGYCHKADVQTALTNVCFEAKNGHDAGVTPLVIYEIYRR
jgi:hypothetical protein